MKLKKNIVAIILLLSLCAVPFMMSACTKLEAITDKTEALEFLIAAENKMDELTNYSMNISGHMKEDGQTVNISGDLKQAGEKISMELTVGTIGLTMDIKSYYSDGFLYTSSFLGKSKQELPFDEAYEEIMGEFGSYAESDEDMFDGLDDEEYVFEGKVEKNMHVFTFTKGDEVQIYKVNKDGYLTYLSMQETDMNLVVMTISLSTPVITLPTDLDTYDESEDSELPWF